MADLQTSQVLEQWHAHQARVQGELDECLSTVKNVGELVRQNARKHGDAVLLDLFEDGEQITYAQLDALSDQLAAGLVAAGLRFGEHLAVMLPNCLEFHITWIALAKVGAVIVPINPSYTQREIAHVIEDSHACGWVLTEELRAQHAHLVPQFARLRPSLVIDVQPGLENLSNWHQLLRLPVTQGTTPTGPMPGPDTLLNIQYTSGTTGFPKGCMLTHGYWITLAHSAKGMHAEPYKRFFTAQPFFYMDPFWQLLQTVLSGGCLVIAKKLSATRFFEWLAVHRIEWAQLSELALKSLDSFNSERSALKQVFTFGWSEPARLRFVQHTGVIANESFGMTEIGLGLAMPLGWPYQDRPTSVGRAALKRNACVMLASVDANGTETPAKPGEVGELWIKGEHLFKGYWGNPKANEQAFKGDWFRTGDAFVCDEAGLFTIVGRFKDMIRRSSENIAAREVESVVRSMPLVLDCAAVAQPDERRGEEVKVWIQWQTGHEGSTANVIAMLDFCKLHLAPFKVPRYVASIDTFPRTSSNKIAKHQLPGAHGHSLFDRLQGRWLNPEQGV